MKKIINFVTLDIISIKPYLTSMRMALFLIVSIISGVTNKSPMISVAMILFLLMSYATYPFAASDQNNLDTLYATLGFKRKEVVAGRYVTMLVLYTLAILCETIMYVLVSFIIKSPISFMNLFFLNITLRVLMIFTQSIQFPIYFKDGYLKSKTSTYLPYMVILAGSAIFYFIVNNTTFDVISLSNFVVSNKVVIVFILIAASVMSLCLSYKISIRNYSKREF